MRYGASDTMGHSIAISLFYELGIGEKDALACNERLTRPQAIG